MAKGDSLTYGTRDTVSGGSFVDAAQGDEAPALRGAQILAKCLVAEGVDTLFGYPGGANLEIFDVLPQFGITCIRTEHEQGAVHAAQGYARVTGSPGVCLATSGPGATNLVTGIADANSDSTPLVAITGNVPSHLLGKNAFQEVDIVAVTEAITKRNYLVKRVGDIPEVVREAFSLAGGNRPGPVLIDIPKDIQQQYPKGPEGDYRAPRIPAVIDDPEPVLSGMEPAQLEECIRLIRESERPVIYAGGGIGVAAGEASLLALAEKAQIPVTWTIMGVGCFPPDHPLSLDVLGMHGAKYANRAIYEADLVLALGVRFDDRVTGNVQEFAKQARIVHIDIDRSELNKNKTVTLPIRADLKPALLQMLEACESVDSRPWVSDVNGWKIEYPYPESDSPGLKPQHVIRALCEATDGDAVVSLGVGQHQMWAMQFYRSRQPRSFLSSSGFGTMGYGLPAAIGAKVAAPNRQVIDIDGDGSLNMTIHELSTCHRYGIGVKTVVINNQWLGMVRQWQDMIYDAHRAGSDLSDPMAVKSRDDVDIYPDFLSIAKGYRVKAERVRSAAELPAAIARMLADPQEPYLLDVIVEAEENVYPMIPAGGTYRDIIMSADDLKSSDSSAQGSNI
ncbi:biosynthetic-type acetolactate synthase large subunit [Congregibacter sp.]|uniref:biosynthetic-type acetolactate synthase large subunit n=1 Tax=Congregibacter sp. TaxID=2744308 RepID=UPI00385D5AC9